MEWGSGGFADCQGSGAAAAAWGRSPSERPGDTHDVARRLSFVDLVDLLEFSRLKVDPPARRAAAVRGGTVIGTLDWVPPGQWRGCADAGASDVYVCSTVAALQDAILLPKGTWLHVAPGPARPKGSSSRASAGTVRIQALRAGRHDRQSDPYLFVDLNALVRRVVVPAGAPPRLFELVKRVVMARVWVDVVRA